MTKAEIASNAFVSFRPIIPKRFEYRCANPPDVERPLPVHTAFFHDLVEIAAIALLYGSASFARLP